MRLWRLAPWRRAPWLVLGSPVTVLAVVVATAVLACALASAPLLLSSARSAALQEQLAPQCAEAARPATSVTLRFPPGTSPEVLAAEADAPRQIWTDLGREPERTLLVLASIGAAGNPQGGLPVRDARGTLLTLPANLLWRPDATEHVEVVASAGAQGVWLPASYAAAAEATVGESISVAGVAVPVAGVYTDLFDTGGGPYWCAYGELYLNAASADVPPPALLLATDEATLTAISSRAGLLVVTEAVPTRTADLTVEVARGLVAEQQRAARAVPEGKATTLLGAGENEQLDAAVERAELVEAGLRGPVVAVAAAAAVLALVLVAASGGFWADRRSAEVRLLAARGAGPGALAGKAALELLAPALVGAAVGWLAARLLVGGLGPADDLDPAAVAAAAAFGAAAFLAGLLAAAVVAGLRAHATVERPLGTAPGRLAAVPWELALVVAAGACWLLLESRDAIVVTGGVAQVNGLLVAFPVLAIAGAALLAARLGTRLLPRLRRRAARLRPPVFLAVNRLAAGPGAAAALLVAVTVPVAVLGYTATLTAGSQTTLAAKVGVQIGADRALISIPQVTPTTATDAVGTVLDRYDGSVVDDAGTATDVQVLAVDPATFAGTAFWDGSFADVPLEELVAALREPAEDGRIPVVAAGLPRGDVELRLGTLPVAAEVAGTARVLPGRRTAEPVVLVAADRLPEVPSAAGSDRQSELWTNGPEGPAVEALTDAGGRLGRSLEPADVLTTADFLGISWTFGYLSALAVFVGLVAAAGLLLHLESRSRSRVAGYVMARRLGLSRRAHLTSLVVELGAVAVAGLGLGALLAAGAVAAVHRRLDVDLLRPPTPLLDVPWPAIGLTVAGALLVAVLAARYAQAAADRADPVSVLREAA
ncbi:FtsX-like permease family protein [Blastococcus sp. LR1]|uniref:FtsX-like permease family protein n=1 Tax=Blastococcus sp. LR1 TaxID=2877000 RepID=UPI001CCEC296|nr:FtsX-like permease family protein [Blastococcus sp. LR1]MCA0144408.1 hypothetical protein [Blastococcus sp. LR1]